MLENIAPFALLGSGICAGIVIVIPETRQRLLVLAVQYLCVAILVSLSIPLRLGIIKLLTGMIVVGILRLSSRKIDSFKDQGSNQGLPTGWIFRILAVLLISTSALGLGGLEFFQLPRIQSVAAASAILLVALGLLQLGLTERPFGIGIGLVTLISGFEIIYSSLEPSLAMMALIAAIHIGIAIVVSILQIDVETPQDLGVLD
jgi:hypothetical protein